MKIAALAVAASFLIPLAVILFFVWCAKRSPVCTCVDSDRCTCGGAWGEKQQQDGGL